MNGVSEFDKEIVDYKIECTQKAGGYLQIALSSCMGYFNICWEKHMSAGLAPMLHLLTSISIQP
jgi:hypothetical protein